MTIQRMEHVGIVVDDLEAATAFFGELGLKLQGEGQVEGGWVDRVVGLEGVRVEYAMVETPDGHGRLELVKFHSPSGRGGDGHAPANILGIRSSIGSATSAARRGSSSSWRSESADGSGTRRLGDEAYHVARDEEMTRDPAVELALSVESHDCRPREPSRSAVRCASVLSLERRDGRDVS